MQYPREPSEFQVGMDVKIEPDALRRMTGIELRRLRRSMGMELSEFQAWRSKTLGEPQEPKTPFTNRHGRPLWLEGIYSGAAFLICGGPSLGRLDLSKLNRRGVWTMAVNNAGCVFRTNSLIIVDPPQKFHSSLWLDPYVQKFVPQGMGRYGLHQKVGDTFEKLLKPDGAPAVAVDAPNVVLYARCPCFDEDTFLSEPNVVWGVSKKWHMRTGRPRVLNSMLAALSVLWKLGFKQVYLLGCDFSMRSDQPYAFSQGGDAQKAISNNHAFATLNQMFHDLRPRFDAAGYHVYNTNPTSALTAFDFVSYDESIRAATSHIQQDPLDTAHWYDKLLGKVGSG